MSDSTIQYPWSISLFPSMISATPTKVVVKDSSDMSKIFESPRERDETFDKKQLPCWSPAIYGAGERRGNEAVKAITSLVYDFDHDTHDIGLMAMHLNIAGVAYVLHSTWSHSENEHRYRLILFLTRDLKPSEYAGAWDYGYRVVLNKNAGVDQQAKNISRHYALPSKKNGHSYFIAIGLEGKLVDVDAIPAPKSITKPSDVIETQKLTSETIISLDSGEAVLPEGILAMGEGKYKCTCPFQADASAGSAFARVTKDGRLFVQCTSTRHTHTGSQFWLSNSKNSKGRSRSVEARVSSLSEIPDELVEYCEDRIAYNALQGVFYRHAEGAWQISTPMRKENLTDHLVGLLSVGCDKTHATALIDHILSRQVYGFDCQPVKDRRITHMDVPHLNLYAWPDLAPAVGKWGRIDQLLDVLAANDPDAKKWLVHWSAALIQNPERRAMTAVLVLSPQQGIGKSMYGRLLAEIIAPKNTAVVSNRALRDNFNAHYVTSLLILADEVGIKRSDQDVIAEIKAAITDDRIHCSTPYAARTTVTNRMTWWMTSNQRQPFVVEADDRRFTILSPSHVTMKYRNMLRDCFDSKTSKFVDDFYEEVQAFAFDLNNVEVDYDLISRPCASRIKAELQSAGMSSIDSYMKAVEKNGAVTMITSYPPSQNYFQINSAAAMKAIPCETLYGSYREWCSIKGRSDLRSETFVRLTAKSIRGVTVKAARFAGVKMDVYVGLPSVTLHEIFSTPEEGISDTPIEQVDNEVDNV